ncbi:MAG TPA: hypothetical protein DDW50_00865 [Firmicutes bacterium]|jgi:hypothetical protein|nr:hypothetical protein [Bacillota bacterium]
MILDPAVPELFPYDLSFKLKAARENFGSAIAFLKRNHFYLYRLQFTIFRLFLNFIFQNDANENWWRFKQ